MISPIVVTCNGPDYWVATCRSDRCGQRHTVAEAGTAEEAQAAAIPHLQALRAAEAREEVTR